MSDPIPVPLPLDAAIPIAAPVAHSGEPVNLEYAQPFSQYGNMLWRDRNRVVMSRGTELPFRCIRCNAPAEKHRYKRTLYWHHPAIYLTILPGLLIYLIVALIVRKRAVVQLSLCDKHCIWRRCVIGAAWLSVALCIGGIYVGGLTGQGVWAVAGLFTLLAGVIFYIVVGQLVFAKKIDDQMVIIGGVSKPFLDSLPGRVK